MNWISVKDRLPAIMEQVLVYTDKRRIDIDRLQDYVGGEIPFFLFYEVHVTHWMPLPEPPEVEK